MDSSGWVNERDAMIQGHLSACAAGRRWWIRSP